MRNRVSEMTNHLAKASGFRSVPQDDRVVGDHDERPVCLDAVPGAHKHLSKSEMLFHVLVEGFDPDPLQIKPHHLGFGHLQAVGYKEPRPILHRSGDKEEHRSDFGQRDQTFCHPKLSFLGSSDGRKPLHSLCQMSERSSPSIHFHNSVSFDSGKECPFGCLNQIENGGAGIPAVHQDHKRHAEFPNRFSQNLLCDLDLALEGCKLGASAFGPVTLNGPNQACGPSFQNRCYGAQALDKPIRPMMDSNSLDLLSLSWAGRIVQNEKRRFGIIPLGQLTLVFVSKFPDLLGRCFDKLVQAVGVAVSKLSCNLPDRSEFDKPDKSDQVNEEINPLGLRENSQEPGKIGRNFVGCFFAHGFHAALLAFVGIGDFGWKPFYFQSEADPPLAEKRSFSSVT